MALIRTRRNAKGYPRLTVSVCEAKNSGIMTPPGDILLDFSSRFRLTPDETAILRKAAAQASVEEWAEVEGEAFYRRTAGLLCHHLRGAGLEPSEDLRGEYTEIARANMVFEAELRRIAPYLREAGLRILLIKGSALHHAVYRNPGIRPFEDSDWVLANENDASEAGRVLQGIGYEACGDDASPKWVRDRFAIEFHRNFLGDERVAARSSGIETGGENHDGGVWRRALASALGEPFLVPSAEDHLIILCAHLMKHNFEPGIWFTDLQALLAETPAFDWEAAILSARSWGLLRPVAFAFRNLGVLDEWSGFPIPIPRETRWALTSVRRTFLDKILLALAARGGRLAGEKEEWERVPVANLLWLSSLESPGEKFRLLWEAAFPRGEVMAGMYPAYCSGFRWWFMLRRTVELARLAFRLVPMARGQGRGADGRR